MTKPVTLSRLACPELAEEKDDWFSCSPWLPFVFSTAGQGPELNCAPQLSIPINCRSTPPLGESRAGGEIFARWEFIA
jgi:hypothetical protein